MKTNVVSISGSNGDEFEKRVNHYLDKTKEEKTQRARKWIKRSLGDVIRKLSKE